ncbi:TIGR02391 family protein [Chromobacterium piscinae]|uniref:TIGR02391 family protein n=1 Tax=Chromobacterium piscinae TaxID=686831 RepID=UPI001E5BC925|nr:TIGR02391 family protein [Chromobacterium piscinae]MCD4504502.1 TIGR02391 family protein [Chromobacterium piscinae]
MAFFNQTQLEAIAAALGHTEEGLKGAEIEFLLRAARMSDVTPADNKRHRIYNAFVESQNTRQDRTHILAFIRFSMKPERYLTMPERFELMRQNLNSALLFAGLTVNTDGSLVEVPPAKTLAEAQRRAQELRADLVRRDVHPEVLEFCREELLADNYFHAVLEAVKSVLEKIRQRTGLNDDGNLLIDRALSGDLPLLAINALLTESDRSEQKGFANLVRGTVGMFRNTTAHVARVNWTITKSDAEDLLTIVSLIHRRIDQAHMS